MYSLYVLPKVSLWMTKLANNRLFTDRIEIEVMLLIEAFTYIYSTSRLAQALANGDWKYEQNIQATSPKGLQIYKKYAEDVRAERNWVISVQL